MGNYDFISAINDTNSNYPSDKTVNELFEAQVENNYNNTALVHNNIKITYGKLNERANKIARVLRQRGIGAETVVAIMLEQSIDRIAAILGILKAGGAYLPVDKAYPVKRIQYMLKDSQAKVLLTDAEMNLEFEGEILKLEEIKSNDDYVSNIEIVNKYNSLLYIIYTSGSTGDPKGVMVEHRNVVRLVKNTNYIEFQEGDKLLQGSSLQFDASTFEIWGALLNGLELHLVEKENMIDIDRLEQKLINDDITIVWMTSPLFNCVSEQNPNIFRKLRYLLVGGDALSPKYIERVRKECKNLKIVNGYGPTENTTFSTCFLIDKEYKSSIPIGKPINNSTAYIMDKNLNILQVGEVGELCVGGDGLSRGYIKNPELNAEKFVFCLVEGIGRIYRTGDLARMLPDGNIEFLGRKDKQVKIRGFRVELGEVEREILSHEDVIEAAVLVKENNGKYMCAYFTAKKDLQVNVLRNYLTEKLPPHMIPTNIIKVDKMPFNTSGKIDTKELMKIDDNKRSNIEIEAVKEIEKELIEIFKEELKLNKIEITDNFYYLGVDSLIAIKIQYKIKNKLKVDIKIRDILDNYTIKMLGQRIEKLDFVNEKEIITIDPRDYYEISSAQRRMYLSNQSKGDLSYNISILAEFTEKINVYRLQQAIDRLVDRHESLRTSFHFIDDNIYQKIHEKANITVELFTEDKDELLDKDIRKYLEIFELEKAPLLRAKVISLRNYKDVLLINVHHIVFDGLSVQVFFDELTELYNGRKLEKLQFQYKEYAKWHNENKLTNKYREAERYWMNKFSELPKPLMMPYSVEEEQNDKEENYADIVINKEIIENTKTYLNENQSSLYMFFISVLGVLIAKYCNETDIIITSVSGGRSKDEFQKVIGMFVDTFPLRFTVKEEMKFNDILSTVRNTILEAYEHNYQFEELVNSLAEKRNMSSSEISKLFNIVMVLDSPIEVNKEDIKYVNTLLSTGTSKFDMTLAAIETMNGFTFRLEFNSQLFNRKTMKSFLDKFKELLCNFACNMEQNISDIILLEVAAEETTKTNLELHKDASININRISKSYEEPRNEIEKIMVQVWCEVLNRDRVNITDKFLEIGGDSIKAIQLSSRLNKRGLKLKTNNILIHQTIEQISKFVTAKNMEQDNSLIEGEIQLTPIQQWFFSKDMNNKNHFNQSVLLSCRREFNYDYVKRVFEKLVEHHDALRTVFSKNDNGYVQINKGLREDVFSISTYSGSEGEDTAAAISELSNRYQKELNIEKGNLVKLVINNLKEKSYLLIIIHHLVIDEVSWHILLEDFTLGYEQLINNQPITFQSKTNSYKSWSEQLFKFAKEGGFNSQHKYWNETIKNIENYNLGGKHISEYPYKSNKDINIRLSVEETSNLINNANGAYNTQVQDLLLTALAVTVKNLKNEKYIVFDLESHGRESIYENTDITRTIGWFTSIYPVAVPVHNANDLKEIIIRVKEALREVPQNGIGYGAYRYILKDEKFNQGRPKICFNYLGVINETKEDKLFSISSIKRGNEIGMDYVSDYYLEINCQGINNQLELIVSCSELEFNQTAAEEIAKNYKNNLLKIIDHCIKKEETELTPSDLSSKEIDFDLMEEIFEALNNQ
jgi:amino acid adenylation domain-containing protein/non-ribosomal peptide synthase protein (TIGR01720 family)